MGTTKILKCTCKHSFQDAEYGIGMRVMNHAPAKGKKKDCYRCTVCGTTRDA